MSFISENEAIRLLELGEVVALPTETVYGLAGRIDSESALQKIFAVKKRPFFDPLIVHVADRKAAQKLWAEWPEVFDPLIDKFWPGPLTLIAQKQTHVSSLITSGLETVAIRCPMHPQMREVLRRLQVPLAAPSANLFGQVSPTRAQHVEDEFSGQVPIVDGGDCEVGVESTVIAAQAQPGNGWRIQILRPGGVSRESLTALFADRPEVQVERLHSVASPGHLKAHYQPTNPLIILQNGGWDNAIHTQVEAALKTKIEAAVELELASSPQLAARELYQRLRDLCIQNPNAVIYVRRQQATSTSPWEAIWDRLERAAAISL